MEDSVELLEQQFLRLVASGELPIAPAAERMSETALDKSEWLKIFQSQITSRLLDYQSREMRRRNQGFYTIGSAGHEVNAVLAAIMRLEDTAFLHYRDAAFYLQRSKKVFGQTPIYDLLLSFAASSDDPISGGRHKVLGSKALHIPPQTSTIASHLPKAVGAAHAVGLARRLDIPGIQANDELIYCSFGDASVNHSTAQGAINAALWASHQNSPMAIVFVCEDNGIGISTPTPADWVESAFSRRYGLDYVACDGLDMIATWIQAAPAIARARRKRKPLFLHLKLVRLLGHAGSDSESTYLPRSKIQAQHANDPLLYSAQILLTNAILTRSEIIELYQETKQRIARIAHSVGQRPRLTSVKEIIRTIIPPVTDRAVPLMPTSSVRNALFQNEKRQLQKPLALARLLNYALTDIMMQYANAVIFGEDVGRKGGVYSVTTGLLRRFGAARVIDTLLDEQSILGLAIGLAQHGFLPIAEIQFLAYLHNAEDQLRGEAATLPFFSQGQFVNPMLIRIPGLAYQKGFGGHFHNDNAIAVLRDIPGLIIACPADPSEAVPLLRSCIRLVHQANRIVVFLEPIALYMTRDLYTDGDGLWTSLYPAPDTEVPITLGDISVYGEGETLCLLSYGNGYYLSRKAAKTLQEKGIDLRIINLHWLQPLPIKALLPAVSPCKQILIIDECRPDGSVSEGIITAFHTHGLSAKYERITATDSFIPLGDAAQLLLPSVNEIVKRCMQLLGKNR